MLATLVDRFGRMLTTRNARSYGLFDPADTAVLVLSPQVDLFAEDGEWSRLCRIGPEREDLADFLSKCRERGLAIYHSPMVWSYDHESSAVGTTRHLHELRVRELLRNGTPGAEIEPALLERSDHVVHSRSGLNAFVGTGLLDQLNRDGRSRLILLGGVANADLDSSARAAVEYDLDVTVISDLTFAYTQQDHENTLRITLPRIVNRICSANEMG